MSSHVTSVSEAKKEADRLLPILQELRPDAEIRKGHCLELIARRSGFGNWRAFKLHLEQEENKLPAPVESPELTQKEIEQLFRVPESKYGRLTKQEYTEAVQRLIQVSKMSGTSGARAASILLLGLYNGSEWRMDLTDLNCLDVENIDMAITAIRGRVHLGFEPHQLITNGEEVFHDLWDRWIRYHKKNVWKDQCGRCYGSGEELDAEGGVVGSCRTCKGDGFLDPIEEMAESLRRIAGSQESDSASLLIRIARTALMQYGGISR